MAFVSTRPSAPVRFGSWRLHPDRRVTWPYTLVCSIPASGWFCGMGGAVYGGALALLADYAVLGAVQSLQPPGRRAWATLDLNVRYLRPLSPGEGRLYARARTVHHGHRLAVTTVDITDADPRPAVLADASVILLPGLRWSGLERLTDEAHELTPSMRDDSQVPGGR
jgi:uncharacterized protein (TIGR00369 family)